MGFVNFKKTKTSLDGYSFSSKLEASVYQLLKSRQSLGMIKILQVQDHVYLTDSRILFIPDFKCELLETKEVYWVEAKGIETDVYRIKRRLWKCYGPGRLEVYKGTHSYPTLHETIFSSFKQE